eukprot:5702442-Heterocapsa_arctica.AAC.1
MMVNGSGWTAKDMIGPVKTFVEKFKQKRTPDGGGNLLFPADMPCVVFDNLNACFQDSAVAGSKKGD